MPDSSAQPTGDVSPWHSVRITATSPNRDRCLDMLFELGAQGVHEDGAHLVTHFPPDTDLAKVRAALAALDPAAAIEIAPVPPIDWSVEWKSKLRAHDLGALSVVPPWLAEHRDLSRTVVIEPGMAFGTGDHPTTRGVIRLLPALLSRNAVVADLGAGSAVLAIAAAKLGARRVYAVELDGEAIPDALANVQRNDVSESVHVFEGDAAALLPLLAPVDVIVANIISSVLIELLPLMAASLAGGGSAILSGILLEERPVMRDVLAAGGWRIVSEDEEDIWWSVAVAQA